MLSPRFHQYSFIATVLLATAGLTACNCAVAACPAEEFPGQFQGSHEVVASSKAAILVVVQQRDADLKIYRDGPDPLWLNGPGDRYAADYVLVDGSSNAGKPTLCL